MKMSSNMKLLFITQKMDREDGILGAYHRWVGELAKKTEEISVICLYKGSVELPSNVRIYSLGKEEFATKYEKNTNILKKSFSYIRKNLVFRSLYLLRFYRYIWRLRHDYNVVFTHMNPEYVILGGILWKLLGKKIIFWYNHPLGNLRARVAIAFSRTVLHTSPEAFAARYKKAWRMPVGVDTDFFRRRPEILKKKNSILYIGRLSPIKNLDILINALLFLDKKGVDFRLTVAGEPSKASEQNYAKRIKKQAASLVDRGKVKFIGSIANFKTPELYNANAIFVNLTSSGSFDKTIIEAMACEVPVIASNQTLLEFFEPDFQKRFIFAERNAEDLAVKLGDLLKLTDRELAGIGAKMRQLAVENHDLKKLIDKLMLAIQDPIV